MVRSVLGRGAFRPAGVLSGAIWTADRGESRGKNIQVTTEENTSHRAEKTYRRQLKKILSHRRLLISTNLR
jgi:hypothetical protein